VVVDTTGGLAANDACCAAGVPLVWGSAQGAVMAVRPGESACVRCADTAPGGPAVEAAFAGLVGSIQALEALRLLGGEGRPGELIRVDRESLATTRTPVGRRDECPSCAVPARAGSV
jgi:molybdopterin/thiamine biosynthesis adenylyltransferase